MTSISRSALPLSGVQVVDFGQYIAGPAVAMILGDLGASVVHTDPDAGMLLPGGREDAAIATNRNERTVMTRHGGDSHNGPIFAVATIFHSDFPCCTQ